LQTDADLLILGGGCAGLSLALRLTEQPGACRRVMVIESRPDYANDRTWCFWRLGPHRYDPLVKKTWSRLAVRSTAQDVDVDCARTPYQLLEAGAFYDHAREAIASTDTVRLHTGVSVLVPPRPVRGGWRVETSVGGLTALQVIDTRPPSLPRVGDAVLWQWFFGQELICERPVFDPTRVELMDFADDAPGAVAFTYVLPLAPHRALVETTVFDPHPRSPGELALRHQHAVRRLCGASSTRMTRHEAGVLPMGMTHQPDSLGPGHLRVGLMSGAARPAIGYAFQRIQRWADACADALQQGKTPRGHAVDPLLTRVMDRLFIDVMRTRPERAPELFTRLFARTDTSRIVRFLSDHATLSDRIAIAASLPTGLFLRQLLWPVPRNLDDTQTT